MITITKTSLTTDNSFMTEYTNLCRAQLLIVINVYLLILIADAFNAAISDINIADLYTKSDSI